MRRSTMLLSAVLLTACGGSDADYNMVHVDAKEAKAQARIDATVNAVGPREVALKGVPVASPTPNAARGRAFPTPFEGYWGATPNDCELANVDARGRISVDNDAIRFFEMKARVDTLAERSASAIDTVLRFSGDGKHWERATRFVLEQGGTTLLRIEQQDAGRPPLTTRYQRC